jgi:hypothetical protein
MVSLHSSCATMGTLGHMMRSRAARIVPDVRPFMSTRSGGGAGAHGSRACECAGDSKARPPKQPAAVSSVRVRGDATMRSSCRSALVAGQTAIEYNAMTRQATSNKRQP